VVLTFRRRAVLPPIPVGVCAPCSENELRRSFPPPPPCLSQVGERQPLGRGRRGRLLVSSAGLIAGAWGPTPAVDALSGASGPFAGVFAGGDAPFLNSASLAFATASSSGVTVPAGLPSRSVRHAPANKARRYPAEPQRPGRTGQHSTKPAMRRTGAKVRSATVDQAGDMGGSPGASQPRRPAALIVRG
jgi:hypothetical protein